MAMEQIYTLQIITLLDSICFGLTYPFLSTYIQSLGADHVVVGILSVGYLLLSLISTDLICLLGNRRKLNSTIIILFITMLTHLGLIITSSYWFVIFSRYVYCIMANHCQIFCQNLLLQNTADLNKKEYALTIFSVLNGAGYIIGPVIAGCLYDKGFSYIGLLATLLTFISICLAVSLSETDSNLESDSDQNSLCEKVYRNVTDVAGDFKECHYEKNWDLIAIKFLFVSSVMIFYGKFSQILKNNFNSSPVTVGCTYAYLNGLTFAGSYFTAIVKDRYAPFSPVLLIDRSFRLIGTCLLIACYSPVYLLYMIVCTPIVFLTTFIDSLWKELFGMRNEDSLDKLNEPIKIVAGVITPIVFGILCNKMGHHAVIIFSVIPILTSVYIINKYTKHYNFIEIEERKSE